MSCGERTRLEKRMERAGQRRPAPEDNGQAPAPPPRIPERREPQDYVPWWESLGGWVTGHLIFPTTFTHNGGRIWLPRIKWALAGLVYILSKAPKFLAAFFSGRADADTYRKRQAACLTCTGAKPVIKKRRGQFYLDHYCLRCGCPDWWYARRSKANHFKRATCVMNKHQGPSPRDGWAHLILKETESEKTRVEAERKRLATAAAADKGADVASAETGETTDGN